MKTFIYLFLFAALPLHMLAQKPSVINRNTAVLPRQNFWSLRGNTNLNDTANFLGTTDAHPLIFKVNGSLSGRIDFESAASNTSFGYQALGLPAHGYNNTAVGYGALSQDSSGGNNVAVGLYALALNTIGDGNSALGIYALHDNDSGTSNVAIGGGALYANRNGTDNVAVGAGALYFNVNGAANVAIGDDALSANTATANTATGYSAMIRNITGQLNTAYGYSSLYYNVEGDNNTATGSYSLQNNATGDYNTAFGYLALNTNITGNRNTVLGAKADVADANLRNSTAIGYGAVVDASYKVQVGNAYVKSIGGAVGWTNYSDMRIKQDVKENVPGLAFIKLLKPVTYHFNTAKEAELLGRKDSLNEAGDSRIEKMLFTGLIAQDVEKAAKSMNYDFSGVDKEGKIMGLRYSEFVTPLIKAVQEQQSEIEELKAELQELKAALGQTTASSSLQAKSFAANKSVGFSFSPNPVTNQLHVSFVSTGVSTATMQVTDMSGKTVVQKSMAIVAGNYNETIDVSRLASGTYTLQVSTGDGTVTNKFVKQ